VRSSLVKISRETYCFSVRYIRLKTCAGEDDDGRQDDEQENTEQHDVSRDGEDDHDHEVNDADDDERGEARESRTSSSLRSRH